MIERCISPNFNGNRNTYPGQAGIIDGGGLVNSAIRHLAEYKLDVAESHLGRLEMKTGNAVEPLRCWYLVPGRLGHKCPFYANPG